MFRTPLLFLVGTLICSAASADPALIAFPKINIVPQDRMLGVSGEVFGLNAGTVTATLIIDRTDASGHMKTSQSREVSVSNGSTEVVAETSFSVQDGVIVEVTLTLFEGEIPIGSATTILGTKAD